MNCERVFVSLLLLLQTSRETTEIAQYIIGTALTRQMEPDVALPPSGVEMVVQQQPTATPRSIGSSAANVLNDDNNSTLCSTISRTDHGLTTGHLLPPASSRKRLDTATAHRLLSTVIPDNSRIMGLGITFDEEPSSTFSVKSIDPGSTHSSKEKNDVSPELAQSTPAATQSNASQSARKESTGTAVSAQDIYGGTPIAEVATVGPRRWDSGVPGLGNTILGPRHPRALITSSSATTPRRKSSEHDDRASFSTYITSPLNISLAPPLRKPNRAIRTSNKRPANSPPSGSRSTTKVAKVSTAESVYAQSPVMSHKQEDKETLKRFGPRRIGVIPDTEKREKAARLWKADKEELDKEMEKAIIGGDAKTLSDDAHPLQHSSNTDTDITRRVQAGCFSSEAQKIIEYAYGTNNKSLQPMFKQDEANKGHNNSKLSRSNIRPEGRAMNPRRPTLSKASSQGSSTSVTSLTYRKDYTLPSAIKSRTCPPTISRNHTSSAHTSRLDFLTTVFLNLLGTYIHLHSSCPTVRPLQLIHTSLSSRPPTATTLSTALKDAHELLKVLASQQVATLQKLEAMREELRKVGLESVVTETEKKVKETEGDVGKLGEWIGECGYLGDEI